jgi:hypothetical protein
MQMQRRGADLKNNSKLLVRQRAGNKDRTQGEIVYLHKRSFVCSLGMS